MFGKRSATETAPRPAEAPPPPSGGQGIATRPQRVDPNALVADPGAISPPPGTPPVSGAAATPATPQPVAKYIVGEEQLEVTLQIEIVDFAKPASAAAPSK